MKGIKIYKASAGSGKTYSITREYLKFILEEDHNYKKILAVTFTNKATAEMKNRIIQELGCIAKGEASPHISELCQELNLPCKEIQKKAIRVLSLILHNYSFFSISTIDAFFQRVIRSFSKEIRLHASYAPELNQEMVLDEAIDRLFTEIESKAEIKKSLSQFAEIKIREGKRWDFKSELFSKGKNIFDEKFLSLEQYSYDKLSNKDQIDLFRDKLLQLKNGILSQLKSCGTEALSILEKYNLEAVDFKGKSKSFANVFHRLADLESDISILGLDKVSILKAANGDVKDWVNSKDKGLVSRIEQAYYDGLSECLTKACFCYETYAPFYNTILAILPELNSLALYTDLDQEVRKIAFSRNVLLLSDSLRFLNKIIDESSMSFIYEKIGNIYEHFMLDEFQDTSHMQWNAFSSLIENSLSEDHGSMIVGDVKQSIYRWRGGDWNLLLNDVDKQFDSYSPQKITLDTNWRSAQNIISFNNSLFQCLPHLVKNILEAYSEDYDLSDIVKVYDEHFQKNAPKSNSKGYVEFNFWVDKDQNVLEEEILEKTLDKIEELQSLGVSPGKIAILVRKGKDGAKIANAIMIRQLISPKPGVSYEVMSEDSLYLSNSLSIRFIISLLKYLANPTVLGRHYIVHKYYTEIYPLLSETSQQDLLNEIENEDLELFIDDEIAIPKSLHGTFTLPEDQLFYVFRKYFHEDALISLQDKSLYTLCEGIISDFYLAELNGEWAFIQIFLDSIIDFSQKNTGGVTAFIQWWDKYQSNKTLPGAKSIDAIQILTIHKSKGLEFDFVLVPFCDWTFDNSSFLKDVIWVDTKNREPFNDIDLIPIKDGKAFQASLFQKEYLDELVKKYIDNLNLLYVVFTRPKEMLWVCGRMEEQTTFSKKVKHQKTVSHWLASCFSDFILPQNSEFDLCDLQEHWNQEMFRLEWGDFSQFIHNYLDKHREHAIEGTSSQCYSIGNSESKLRLKQGSTNFFDITQSESYRKINTGLLIHELFENIVYKEDLDEALAYMLFEGKISYNEEEQLKEQLNRHFKNPQIASWFDPTWEVYLERTIFLKGGIEKRPDRVIVKNQKAIVIDYKSGESEDAKYVYQVRGYMRYLKEIGYCDVEGYLWYIGEEKIIKVFLNEKK